MTLSYSKIDIAFSKLEAAGYFTRKNFWCCQTCGVAAVPDDAAENYIFYHEQDADTLRDTGSCYLCFAGDGSFICTTLNKAGIATEWDGSDRSRIRMVLNSAVAES